ncbi:MAG TPA: GEVED domain-containing protein, partial [Chitinophagaceae bacterium]|nr:GEVED domain-containing protein [Chitinophagaceae bacterium]
MAMFLCSSRISNAQIIFSEDWTSGSFATNNWTFPSGQANWSVGTLWAPPGGTPPHAVFNWNPTLTSYSNELVSPVINATSFAGGSVYLSYKMHYDNWSSTTLEQLAVEYKPTSSTTWFLLTNYTNAGGSFNVAPSNVILPAMAGQNFQIRFRPYGINSFNINGWGIDDISVLALNPCTGTPVAGTATALPNNPCPGIAVTLDLTGATIAGGLAYQWQRGNTPTGPWVNIGTGNPYYYTPAAGSTTFYRCIVTCTATGLTATSGVSGGVVVQSFSATSPCYCPCTNLGTACITNVTYGSLNSTTAPCTNPPTYYNMYTTPVPNLTQGLSYPFTMTTDASAITSVWIDWNHNTVFETTEWTQIFTTGTTGTVNILVPPSSLVGQTRMRVRSRLTGNQNGAPDACLAMGSGETEDYVINVIPAGPYDLNLSAIAAPVGNNCTDSSVTLSATVCNFGSNPIVTSAANPVTVTFKVTGPGGLTTYNYTFPPGLTIGAFGATCQTATVSPVNMFAGGS